MKGRIGVQSPYMIRIQGLKKVYGAGEGAVTALSGVDLLIRRGDIHGIIGMSGAGKSTLIRCINLLDRPTEGLIEIDGQDVTHLNEKELRKMRRSVGMIFQQFNLLMQRTVLKNVCFPMELSGVSRAQARARALELLELVGLKEKAGAYPAQLSGGQKQRVAIARSLAMDPKVLLCDEATSALDPMTTASILQLLKDINTRLGITIVVITHEMEVIRQICSNVSIIDGGVIAESGAVSELFSRPQSEAGRRLFHTGEPKIELPTGRMIRVIFDGSTTFEPVIAQMILTINAPVSIVSAQTNTVGQERRGQMVLELPEDPSVSAKAVEYLASKGLTVEEVKD